MAAAKVSRDAVSCLNSTARMAIGARDRVVVVRVSRQASSVRRQSQQRVGAKAPALIAVALSRVERISLHGRGERLRRRIGPATRRGGRAAHRTVRRAASTPLPRVRGQHRRRECAEHHTIRALRVPRSGAIAGRRPKVRRLAHAAALPQMSRDTRARCAAHRRAGYVTTRPLSPPRLGRGPRRCRAPGVPRYSPS